MSDWLDVAEDSPELDALVDEQVASMLDSLGVGADDPMRARVLAEAWRKAEATFREKLADARSRLVDTPQVLQ